MDVQQRMIGFQGDILIVADTEYGVAAAGYTSGAGATNSGATVTVGSTTGLLVGMKFGVTSGLGQFSTTARVKSITNATTFVSTEAPIINLSASAVIKASWGITPEWIVCPTGISIVELEEYIDNVSTDVLAQHGLITSQALPANYILKSVRGAGFSKLKITGGNGNGFILSPERERNTKLGSQSGVYSANG